MPTRPAPRSTCAFRSWTTMAGDSPSGTTTPWTIPGNLAITRIRIWNTSPMHCRIATSPWSRRICLHSFSCATARRGAGPGRRTRWATIWWRRRRSWAPRCATPSGVVKTLQGSELAGVKYRHPLIARETPVVLGAHRHGGGGHRPRAHAPATARTTSPGRALYGLPIFGAGGWPRAIHQRGRHRRARRRQVFDANPKIVEMLGGAGALIEFGRQGLRDPPQLSPLLALQEPVIFRATDQLVESRSIKELDLPGRGRTTIRKSGARGESTEMLRRTMASSPPGARSDPRHGRESPRLVRLAPARLGRGHSGGVLRERSRGAGLHEAMDTSAAILIRKARTPGSTRTWPVCYRRIPDARSAAQQSLKKRPTSSTSGSTRARASPPCSPAELAHAGPAGRPLPRGLRSARGWFNSSLTIAVAPAAPRPTRRCSPTASSSTAKGARSPSLWATRRSAGMIKE